jgi:hypothetical protein
MIYKYLELIKSQKILLICIITIFISIYIFDRISINYNGTLGIFIGLIICWYLIDKKITIKNENKNMISKIIKELPILKELETYEDFLLFYYKNKSLIDYDIINFDNSILNAINFIKVYKRIENKSKLSHYQFDILEKHRYLCLEYFKNIELNIPNQKDVVEYLRNNIDELSLILNKYLNKNLKLLNSNNYDIYYKFINTSKVKEFNKYDYII